MSTRLFFAGLFMIFAATRALVATEDPEQLVSEFFTALKNNDLFGASGMVHPESLDMLATRWNNRVVESFDKPAVIAKLQTYTHGDPKAVVSRYSGRVVFERFMEYLLVSNGQMKNVLQRSQVNVVGSKSMAGTTIVQVEYVTEEKSKKVVRSDSVRVRKDGLEFKVLLTRELERALDLMVNPPVKVDPPVT
jgi:hypothetical protein